jgi:hypothetical protein
MAKIQFFTGIELTDAPAKQAGGCAKPRFLAVPLVFLAGGASGAQARDLVEEPII